VIKISAAMTIKDIVERERAEDRLENIRISFYQWIW
jgi:hypothetical protein